MKQNQDYYVAQWLEHVRVLADEIGPRGSTREGERRGSEYCARVLDGVGLSSRMEYFDSARSIYHPHLLASEIMLLAFAIYPLAGRASAAVAALLSLLALGSDLLELGLRDNLLRRLVPKGKSQNVIAVVPPAEGHRQDLVLLGHVDSHRTPIIFSSPRWLGAYKIFVSVAFVLFVGQVALYLLGAIFAWDWIWPLSIPGAVAALLLAALSLHADRTPFSAGANDNATGAGLVLALGVHLQDQPLRHTRVWLVCTGCEEVQHYGAIDFFRRHRSELQQPVALVLEMLGCAGPAWLTQEGILVPFHADRELVDLAEQLAAQHPEWGAHPTRIEGGNTEMADALRAGVPAITLQGMGPDGEAPYWHQPEDTFDKIAPEILRQAYAFAWTFVQALDERAVEKRAQVSAI